jgi:hypothetical protein
MRAIVIEDNKLKKLDWDAEKVFSPSKDDLINHILDQEWFDTESLQGLTYGDIQELDYYNR